MQIETIRPEWLPDQLPEIERRLNALCTSQEDTESRFELHCLAVAHDMGCHIEINYGTVTFDFSRPARPVGCMMPLVS
jgi:hypothetical protein